MDLTNLSTWVAFVLTLFVYSYLFFDSFLYRLAIYLFAGLTAGFVAIVTYDSVIAPWVDGFVTQGGIGPIVVGVIPLLITLFLLLPPIPGLRVLTNPFRKIALAFLVGVGAAVALVGAVTGTVIPLSLLAGGSMAESLLLGSITVVGVVCTLYYFQYAATRQGEEPPRQGALLRSARAVGGFFIAVTFGTLYAAAITTTLTIFSERWSFIISQFSQLFGG